VKRVALKPKMAVSEPVIKNSIEPQHVASDITDTKDLFVLAHAGVPEVDAAEWSLEICGLVGIERTFTLADLRHLPLREVTSIHRCAGNPFDPTTSSRQIANVSWRGVDLRTLLDATGVDPRATHLWTYGLECGEFFGHEVTHYVKDVPLPRVSEGDVLIALELNGKELSAEHGFPARLVIPGYYGTNHVKWICRLELADRRPEGLFTTQLYFDAPEGGERKPVWEIDPEAIFVSPLPSATIGNQPHRVWGRAWSSAEVVLVEVSVDGGKSWNEAELSPRKGHAWQTFALEWQPLGPGIYRLLCRATDAAGRTQPMSGWRNEVHSIEVDVSEG
jgi:DMSO/TMAO reductase YedYZ molybdopterin-dependent catalytic subunit